MKFKLLTVIASFLAIVPLAQAQVPAEIEGTIISATAGAVAGSASMVVMDVDVIVPAGIPISTPTSDNIGVAGLLNTAPFSGRSQEGFVGGTAIVIGTVDGAGVLTAESVFVEPAENVVLGLVTAGVEGDPVAADNNNPQEVPIRINGMLVKFLDDPRIDFDVPRNDLGFEVDRAAIDVGTEVAIEGYYSATDNVFYAFLLEAVGVPALDAGLQVAILRAQGRTDRGELEVRGGVSGVVGAGAVNVQIFRVRPAGTFGAATRIGTVAAVADLVPGTFTFRFQAQGVTPFPDRVVARIVRNGVRADSEFFTVDAR